MREAVDLLIREDDLIDAAVRAFIESHVDEMAGLSPPESMHALGVDALRAPDITVWSAWVGDELVGCGALKRFDGDRGEIKSMRVSETWARRGIGRAILDYVVREAERGGVTSLWLETGSTDDFLPARAMYERAGFTYCAPFGSYVEDPESVFMRRDLRPAAS